MDELTTTPELSLGQEMGKTFAISLASTAGVVAGFILVGTVAAKLQERKDRKSLKLQEQN